MSKVKLTDYVVEFLQKKGIHDFFGYQGTMIAHLVDSIEKNPHDKKVIPAIMSRELLLPPAVMLRQRMPAAVPMLPVSGSCQSAFWCGRCVFRFSSGDLYHRTAEYL